MLKLNLSPFFHPEEVVEKAELNKEDVIEILGQDDDNKEIIDLKDEKKPKEKTDDKKDDKEEKDDEEIDELDELEEELEGPDEDKLELVTPVRRKDILKEYPDLFKKFPYLEKAYYREQQFTEIVPTIEDAKIAVEAKEVLDKFESDISKGDLSQAIKAVKASGDEAFYKLVDDYLPNLARVDKDAYHHVVGNIVKTTIVAMINEGKSSNDEDLQAAAKILNQFVFGTNQITNPTVLSNKKTETNDAEVKLAEREQALLNERFETSKDELNTKLDNTLKATIQANMDPKESMTEYVRRNAVRECKEKLDEILEKDKRLTTILNMLWQSAAKDNFSKVSIDKIKSAYLSKAKTVLPTLIKQARNEALKGLGKRVSDDDDTPKKGPIPAGRSAAQSNNSSRKTDREKAAEIPKSMSNRDYLMQD